MLTKPAQLLAASLVVMTIVTGCGSDAESEAESTEASASSSPTDMSSTSSEPPAPKKVTGFEGAVSFPMTFMLPGDLTESSEGPGTRAYIKPGLSAGFAAFLVTSVDKVEEADVPTDVAGFIRKRRPELRVSEIETTQVGGDPAQAFTLTQKSAEPFDLWCVRAGSCYKLLPDKPMDMTAVRTGKGLVLFTVEYMPEEKQEARATMQEWLGSIRWR